MSLPNMPINQIIQHIPAALSVYFNQLVYDLKNKDRDIIQLSLGEAYFDIPRFEFSPLDFQRGCHYSDSQGLPELREKIIQYYQNMHDAVITSEDVLISAGSKIIIFMCMQAILNPGDEIIIHEPAWLSYQEQARLLGSEIGFIPFSTPCRRFQDYFSKQTRILILNNPNNPSGNLYSRQDLLDLYHVCRSRGIYLLVDEAYSDFVPSDSFCSLASLVRSLDGVIIVNSLSKNMGISGWRIGYVIARPPLMASLLKLNQHLITCAPTILQQYLARYFDNILSHTLIQARELVAKRERIAKRMDDIGLQYLSGSATFYFFVCTGRYTGSIHEMALYLLLEKNIAVVPGSAYGASTDRFIRLSIGAESEERIDYALHTIKNVLNGPTINSNHINNELSRLELHPCDFKMGYHHARN